jgi:hypothetical protein
VVLAALITVISVVVVDRGDRVVTGAKVVAGEPVAASDAAHPDATSRIAPRASAYRVRIRAR